MRKIRWMLALICVIACVGGCAAGSGSSTGGAEQTTAENSSAGQAAAQESSTQAVGEEAAKDEALSSGDRPVIEMGSIYFHETNGKEGADRKVLLTGEHETIRLSKESEEKYPALSAALTILMDKQTKEAKKEINDLKETLRENKLLEVEEAGLPFKTEDRLYVQRADSQVLSVLEKSFGYTGGAHGFSTTMAINLDAATGKEIALTDVFADQDRLIEVLKKYLTEKYEKDTFFDFMPETIAQEVKGEEDLSLTWTLEPQGITFYFDPYEIGPYAAGELSVTILYSAEEGLFTDRYRPEEGSGYVCGVPLYTGIGMDADGDGKVDDVHISYTSDEKSDAILSMMAVVNDKELTVDKVYCYDIECKSILTGDGRAYLYAWCTSDNDYVTLYRFDISSGTPVSLGSDNLKETSVYNAGEESDEISYRVLLTDPSSMPMSTRCDLLSTYDAFKVYSIDEGPELKGNLPFYTILGEITPVSLKDIEARYVSIEGDVEKEAQSVPAGTTFKLIRTDGESYVDAQIEDGKMVRLEVTGDYPQYINGVEINELFKDLVFAG